MGRKVGRSRGVSLDAEELRRGRLTRSLTQEDVAELAGLSIRSYQTAERGSSISVASARAIAEALGRSVAEFARADAGAVQVGLAARGHAPLPPPIPWAGRAEEARAVLAVLEGRQERIVCCLTGPSGVGKTALARLVAAQLGASQHEGIAWVAMPRHRDERQVIDTMLNLADAIGFRAGLPSVHAVERESFHAAFRTLFWRRNRLLVLDDVAPPDEAEPFLSAAGRVWAVVTSAHRAVGVALGAPEIEIRPLSPIESKALLAAHVGRERLRADPAASRRLVELLGGVPRSIQIAGKILRAERYTTPRDYAARLAAVVGHDAPEPLLDSSDALFERAYSQLRDRMSPESWRVLGALSAFEDRTFSMRWAEAVAAEDEPLGARFAELVDLFLLQEHEAGGGAALPGSTRFALDAQALRAAQAVGAAESRGNQHGMLRFALAEARRIRQLDAREADAAFSEDFEVWALCLDRAARQVLGANAHVALRVDDVPPAPLRTDGELGSLPELVSLLEVPLWLRHVPEAGLWLTAALAVARQRQDRLAEGRLLVLLNRWWSVGYAEHVIGCAFGRASVQALDEAGDPEQAHRALFYLAASTLGGLGPAAGARLGEEMMEHARRAGLGAPAIGAALHDTGLSRAMAAATRAEWDRARGEIEEALSLLSAPHRTSRTMHATALVSLAVLRRTEGDRTPVARLAEATTLLLDTVAEDPLDRVLIAWLGHYLAGRDARGPAHRPGPSDLHRAILDVPARAIPGRIVKIGQIAFALGRPGYTRVGPQPDGVPPGVCMTELVVGTPTEVELGRMVMMLYPVQYLLELVNQRTLELATGFLRSTCAPEHPLLRLLEGVLARGIQPTAAS